MREGFRKAAPRLSWRAEASWRLGRKVAAMANLHYPPLIKFGRLALDGRN
jgi:hypothetical protein